MKYKFISFFLFLVCFSFFTKSDCQKSPNEAFNNIIKELRMELDDSLTLFNSKFIICQNQIIENIKVNDLDPKLFIGKDSSYIKYGLSKYYKYFFDEIYYSQKLENKIIIELYRQIYMLDLKIRITKCMIKLHSTFKDQSSIIINDFVAFYYPNISDLDLVKAWMISKMIGNFYFNRVVFDEKNQYDSKRDLKMLKLEPSCDELNHDDELKEVQIIESWPRQGQYAYYPTFGSTNLKQGYMFLNMFPQDYYQNNNLYKIKWTAPDERFVLSDIISSYETNSTFNFYNPDDFLEPGLVYKIELVKIDDSSKNKYKDIINIFQNPYLPFNLVQKLRKNLYQTLFAKKFEPIYFRVSLYASQYDKMHKMDTLTKIDNLHFQASIKESLDEVDLKGTECFKSTLRFDSNILDRKLDAISKRITSRIEYYLKVPTIYKSDDSNISMSNLDNTNNDDIFINCPLSLAELYCPMTNNLNFRINSIEVVQENNVKLITNLDFKNNQILDYGSSKLFFTFDGIKRMKEYLSESYANAQKRIVDRANYYYLLDNENAKKNSKKLSQDIDYYIQREKKIVDDIFGQDIEKLDYSAGKGTIYLSGNVMLASTVIMGLTFKY